MTRVAVIVLAAVAVAVAAWDHYGGRSHRAALQVPFAYSTNEEELLLPLIDAFNKERHEVAGRPVEIVGQGVSSGEAEAKIAAKQLRPTIWSPASSLWG